MSHMVEGNRMFYAGEVPWHGLGVGVEDAVTSAEAIKLAQLDTLVEMMPVYVKVGRKLVEAEEFRAAVRTQDSRVFGIASREYSPYQNHECFEFMDSLVADGSLKYETTGSLFGGKKIWILARVPHTITVGGGDEVYSYLLLFNGHDRKTALQVLPTTVRVVCNNTLNMALGRNRRQLFTVHIKHRGSLEARISEAREILNLSIVEFKVFDKAAQILDKRDGLPLVDKFLNALFPPPEKDAPRNVKSAHESRLVDLQANLTAEGTARGGQLSAWSLLQGVVGYIDHQESRSMDDEFRADRRMRSVVLGKKAKRKEEAANLLLGMTRIIGDVQKERQRLMVPVSKKVR